MGFRFRKSISIGKGLRLNLNKKSIGFSVGTKGMRFSINSKGRRTANVGIPGTGLYYTKTNNSSSSRHQSVTNNNTSTVPNNETCKKCGAAIYPTDKVCRNCGYNLQNKDIPTIIGLVLFFPIGLYFMWTKTNWNKIIKIIITTFFAINCIFFTAIALSTTDDLPEVKVSQTGITELEFLQTDDIELDLTSRFKSNKNSYFYVKGNDTFNIEDIEFISSNPDVAKIKYSKTTLTTHVYYDITAVSPGEATVYVQTKDGIIKSEEIKVIVVGETTTEPTTEEQTSIQKETTTQKETSTQKVTTTKSQSNKSEVNSSDVLNTDSMKFHKPSCHVAKKIDTENFSQSNKSYEELINDGYSPCGICLK